MRCSELSDCRRGKLKTVVLILVILKLIPFTFLIFSNNKETSARNNIRFWENSFLSAK